jgi:hypothetical protein
MWTDKIPVTSLPLGELVVPDPDLAEQDAIGPVMWMTREPVDGSIALWRRLWATRAITGLYPLILPDCEGMEGRPWSEGELCPVPWAEVQAVDVEEELGSRWAELVAASDPATLAWTGHPDGTWPGLAPAAAFDVDPDNPSDLLDSLPRWFDVCRIGLVPARTGSRALATVGWLGAANHYVSVAPLAAIIRSWEERCGFRLIAAGFDQLIGSHACRPLPDPVAIAVEHYLTCPDELDQNFAGDTAEYLKDIASTPGWGLWWD